LRRHERDQESREHGLRRRSPRHLPLHLFEFADQLRAIGVTDPYLESLESEVLRLRGGQR
jgi:hypothetical protein